MSTIILVRHGENEWVRKHRLAGWIEGVHLNENGRQQATDTARRLALLPIKAIYSSPVTRCMETAEYIAKYHDLPITELKGVGEVVFGKWEGKKIKKLAQTPLWRIVQFFPSRMRFPKGESFLEVQFRAVNALEQLAKKHENETIVVASHADVIKVVLAHYLGTHIDLFQRLTISPASISVIQLPSNGTIRILRINDTGAFEPPIPPKKTPEQSQNKEKE